MSSLFVVAGLDGFIATSQNGKKWNSQTGREGDSYKFITFGSGKCLLGGQRGGENVLAASSDGKKWELSIHRAEYTNYATTAFHYDGKMHVLGGRNSGGGQPFVINSSDGKNWSNNSNISGKHLLRRCAQGNGLIVSVGDYGRKSVSKDGINWEDSKGVKALDTLIDVSFGNGVFVGGGLHGMRMLSEDGLKWSKKEMGEEGEHINSMLFDGKQFVGVGLGGTYFSQNGKSWRRVANNEAPHIVAYGNGIYVGAKWKGKIFTSKDAIKWEEVANLKGAVTTIGFGNLG